MCRAKPVVPETVIHHLLGLAVGLALSGSSWLGTSSRNAAPLPAGRHPRPSAIRITISTNAGRTGRPGSTSSDTTKTLPCLPASSTAKVTGLSLSQRGPRQRYTAPSTVISRDPFTASAMSRSCPGQGQSGNTITGLPACWQHGALTTVRTLASSCTALGAGSVVQPAGAHHVGLAGFAGLQVRLARATRRAPVPLPACEVRAPRGDLKVFPQLIGMIREFLTLV
jgi:hypothetical protein